MTLAYLSTPLVPDTESFPSQVVSTRNILMVLSMFRKMNLGEMWKHFLIETDKQVCRLDVGLHVLGTNFGSNNYRSYVVVQMQCSAC